MAWKSPVLFNHPFYINFKFKIVLSYSRSKVPNFNSILIFSIHLQSNAMAVLMVKIYCQATMMSLVRRLTRLTVFLLGKPCSGSWRPKVDTAAFSLSRMVPMTAQFRLWIRTPL